MNNTEGNERIRTAAAPGADSVYDRLGETCRQMTDEQLRGAIEAIRGNPKRAGARAAYCNCGGSAFPAHKPDPVLESFMRKLRAVIEGRA